MPRPTVLALVFLFALLAPLKAAPPSAALLPGNTKLHVTIPDYLKLKKAWQKTKVSQLFDDPKIKPFLDDVTKESTIAKLGLNWEDLAGVARGEMSFAVIPTVPGQAAHVITLVTGSEKAAVQRVLAKVATSLKKQGYAVSSKTMGGVPVTTYTRAAADRKEHDHHLFSFTKDDALVAADNEKAIADILQRWRGNAADRLDQRKPYQEVLARAKAQAKTSADFFWFLEPIGLAEAIRTTARVAPRRGPDMLKILKEEGFTAFQGIGGFVSLGHGEYEALHYTTVYAPGPYQKSMRMIKTLPGDAFTPPDWVPSDLARYEAAYVDLGNAFRYFGSYFDAVYGEGDVGTFDDILKGMRDDPNGPQVDVSKEVIGRLGQRVNMVIDAAKPIGPNSVRSLIGIAAKDEKGLALAIRRLMENDEDIKPHKLAGGVVLWEMITREKKRKGSKPAAAKPKAPNTAVAVAHGQLFLASDVKLLEKIIAAKDKGLGAQADYQRVAKALTNLGAGKTWLRSFTRPDEDFLPVYELLRTNQLEKSRSMYAQFLVELFGDKLTQIDGSTFPDYQNFRRYLGPAGLYSVNQTDGWIIVGCSLRK